MKSIAINNSKTLKLLNTLTLNLSDIADDAEDLGGLEKLVSQMETYVRSKGAQPIGPLIQKTSVSADANGEVDVNISFIRQADTYINHTEPPYHMESVLRVADCLYARFIGEEADMRHAYNKLGLIAYEEEIELSGETYTVYVDSDEASGTLTADIFMPRKM
jgi:uncharacterized protein YecE (DUF72 family)